MKKLATLLTTLLIWTASYGQELETMGAGVIDFLLTNPKTANQTNPTEAAALNVLGNLLSISASRQHDMNVANAGRSEIVINTNTGSNATVYSDTEGKVYLLYNGTIYPISVGLVNQAKTRSEPEIENSTLPTYNFSALTSDYKFEKTKKLEEYFLEQQEETIEQIAKKHNISVNDVYFKEVIGQENGINQYDNNLISETTAKADLKRIYNGEKLKRINHEGWFKGYCNNLGLIGYKVKVYAVFLNMKRYEHEIVSTFTCNWAKDFSGDGLDLDDFQGIKRSFYQDEKQLFVMGYTTETAGTWTLEVYEASSGETVYKKTGIATEGGQVVTVNKYGDKLSAGVYIYNFTLTADGQDKVSKSEKFEIIENTNTNTDTEK